MASVLTDIKSKASASSIEEMMHELGRNAKMASRQLVSASTADKNAALNATADAIIRRQAELIEENKKDLDAGREHGLSDALIDRLELNAERIESMADGLRQIAALPDPVGEISDMGFRPSGIQVGHMRVPLGVVGIIYESRPNVTADAAGLCLKSGNAAILRGGSEAAYSNHAIARCIHDGLRKAGLPLAAVQVVPTTDRHAVSVLVQMDDYVDVIVPRGGKGLIERVSAEARVPVIKHLHGVCHVYIDGDADIDKAVAVAVNSKTQRYGTCNTMETLLVADSIATMVLPLLAKEYSNKGVELRGCARTQEIIADAKAASEEDWHEEYLAPILSIRVVDGLNQALDHIDTYSSRHTDSIVSENYTATQRFLREVDSSSVMVNVSTRFADGFEYGLGAEIGISTDKIHVRGPVGLHGLTSQKYIVLGDGHIRQ